jgi:hypothetical protein
MKSRNNEATERILMLLKIDANNLFNRVSTRKTEYLEIFALRRTREHFPAIFKNRYDHTNLHDLSSCSTDVITSLDQYYTVADEVSWYLFQTEDMPNTVETYMDRKIKRMEKLLSTLNLFLDAELGIEGEMKIDTQPLFIDQPESQDFSTFTEDDTSQES